MEAQKIDFKIEHKLSEEESAAFGLVNKLQSEGFETYVAGGAVRDELMNHPAHDIDIATAAKPEDLEKIFPNTYERGRKFGVMAVRSGDFEFEVATFRSDIGIADHRRPEKVEFCSAEEDAKRRDFTINGLFYDSQKEKIIDYVGGVEDLKNKIIRFIGEPKERIDEDYLRMLRAVRFSNRFDFTLDKKGEEAIRKNASKIKEISAERIREELTNILVNKNRVSALKQLENLGLLKEVLPEVLAMKGVEQSPEFHSEGDVWDHTMLALQKMEEPNTELSWAVLLHDVGKPQTYGERDVPGRPKITFFEHDTKSAEMAEKILGRLKFSNEFISAVSWAITQHMRIVNAFRGMSERKQKHLFTHPHIGLLLDLTKYDLGSSLRPGDKVDLKMYEDAVKKKDQFEKEAESEEKNQIKKFTLITGRDIMEILKIEAGPEIGKIKEKIENAFFDGKISTRDEALKMIEEEK